MMNPKDALFGAAGPVAWVIAAVLIVLLVINGMLGSRIESVVAFAPCMVILGLFGAAAWTFVLAVRWTVTAPRPLDSGQNGWSVAAFVVALLFALLAIAAPLAVLRDRSITVMDVLLIPSGSSLIWALAIPCGLIGFVRGRGVGNAALAAAGVLLALALLVALTVVAWVWGR